MKEQREPFASWAILELMGHRRLAGFVREDELAGQGMWRVDVPGRDGQPVATQWYSPAAVYSLTPTTEEMARAVAIYNQPEPVTPWELPPAPARERNLVEAGYDVEGIHEGCDDDDGDESTIPFHE